MISRNDIWAAAGGKAILSAAVGSPEPGVIAGMMGAESWIKSGAIVGVAGLSG